MIISNATRLRPGATSTTVRFTSVLAAVGVVAAAVWAAVPPVEQVFGPEPAFVTAPGAVPDDDRDDTAALQQALDRLRPGETLKLDPGTYTHSDVLTVRVGNVTVQGPAQLVATDELRSAVRVDADGVALRRLTLGVAATTRRHAERQQHKLWLSGRSRITVRDVTVTGSAAAGVFVEGTTGFRLENVVVSDTRADGIHMTAGASDGVVDRPVVARTGDDGVAVVSYDRDTAPCRSIQVLSPTVNGTAWGRGLSVVGGIGIAYTDVTVRDTDAAAIYIAVEGDPFYSRAVDGVVVRGGRVEQANRNATIDHGALVVLADRTDHGLRAVDVSGLALVDTRPTASHTIGVITANGATPPQDLSFTGLTFGNGPVQRFGGNVPPGAYRVEGG